MDTKALYTTCRVGTAGHEIRDPEGNVVAWAVDEPWAAILVGLLNTTIADTGAKAEECVAEDSGDHEEAARRAIEYLAGHDLVVAVTFPKSDPPSPKVRDLVEPYLRGAQTEVGDLLVRYVMRRLADEHLGLGGIEGV
jgi:hypothetical protein